MQAGLSTQNAPSVWVVAPHFFIGTISFILASILMINNYEGFLNYFINGQLLAIIHLMNIGWVSIIIFGALYQLIPVVMEVKLYSEVLAKITLVLMIIGLVFLILEFLKYMFKSTIGFEIGGIAIFLAVILFAINTLKSAASSQKKSISKTFIVTSIIYLILTILLGIFILLNLSFNLVPIPHTNLLKIHAAIGLVGWFLQLIIGVAIKLMPMFLIVHKTSEKLIQISYYLINAGIILFLIAVYFFPFQGLLQTTFIGLIIIGFVLFFIFNFLLFRKRLRKKLDIGMQITAVGFIMLLLSLIAFIMLLIGNSNFGLTPGKLEALSGFLLVFGFFTSLILGQTYKTLPFIIWLHKYQSMVGKAKIPLPANLYSDMIAKTHLYTYVLSMISLIIGIVISNKYFLILGSSLMLITAITYSINVFKMIFHKNQIKI